MTVTLWWIRLESAHDNNMDWATTVSESSQRRLSSSDVLEQPSALGFGFTDYRLVKTLFGDLS